MLYHKTTFYWQSFSNCHATLFNPYHPKPTRPTSIGSYINSMIFQLRNLYYPLNFLLLPHQSYFTKSVLPLLKNFASLNAKRTISTITANLYIIYLIHFLDWILNIHTLSAPLIDHDISFNDKLSKIIDYLPFLSPT